MLRKNTSLYKLPYNAAVFINKVAYVLHRKKFHNGTALQNTLLLPHSLHGAHIQFIPTEFLSPARHVVSGAGPTGMSTRPKKPRHSTPPRSCAGALVPILVGQPFAAQSALAYQPPYGTSLRLVSCCRKTHKTQLYERKQIMFR